MGLPVEVNNLMLGSLGGYTVGRSLRFRSSASAYLNWTFGTPTNNKIWTWSGWVKLGSLATTGQHLFTHYTSNTATNYFYFVSNILTYTFDNGTVYTLNTSAVFRDPSAWYHVILAVDTTQATASERTKIYINGILQTLTGSYVPQNTNTYLNSATRNVTIGRRSAAADQYFDGYIAEVNFIDGQALTPSSFGAYDINGVWQPKKYSGTYGTNGFYLPFSNTTSTTTLVQDSSGNGNNWTPNNISLTAGTTYDSMIDSPTNAAGTSTGIGNYAVLNPLQKVSGYAPDNGNLRSVMNATGAIFATIGVTTGKWYWENIYEVAPNGNMEYGVSLGTVSTSSQPGNVSGSWAYSPFNGSVFSQSGTPIATVATASLNDVIGLALDVDAGTLAIYKNNSLLYTITSISGGTLFPVIGGSSSINAQSSVNFGQRPFSYTPPSGFKALNTYNLPAPSIANGAQYMAATLYTGNGGTQTINNGTNTTIGTTFQPDFIWMKSRNNTYGHNLYDSVRGGTKRLVSNLTDAEFTVSGGVNSFNADGMTIQNDTNSNINASATTYVGWQWKGGGTGVTNNSGTITSTVSASPSSGFSIATYTGTGANATVGHGLGVAPSMVIVKPRVVVDNWNVYHASNSASPATQVLYLNLTNATSTNATIWNNTAPTSSVFSIGTNTGINTNGSTYVAYCFSAVSGYSAFGKYTGNGSADGPFIYTGFRPKLVLAKAIGTANGTTNNTVWTIWDTSRNTYNATVQELYPNTSGAESTDSAGIDILSNGFKLKRNSEYANWSGTTYIYAAFAENPFNYSRAR